MTRAYGPRAFIMKAWKASWTEGAAEAGGGGKGRAATGPEAPAGASATRGGSELSAQSRYLRAKSRVGLGEHRVGLGERGLRLDEGSAFSTRQLETFLHVELALKGGKEFGLQSRDSACGCSRIGIRPSAD